MKFLVMVSCLMVNLLDWIKESTLVLLFCLNRTNTFNNLNKSITKHTNIESRYQKQIFIKQETSINMYASKMSNSIEMND